MKTTLTGLYKLLRLFLIQRAVSQILLVIIICLLSVYMGSDTQYFFYITILSITSLATMGEWFNRERMLATHLLLPIPKMSWILFAFIQFSILTPTLLYGATWLGMYINNIIHPIEIGQTIPINIQNGYLIILLTTLTTSSILFFKKNQVAIALSSFFVLTTLIVIYLPHVAKLTITLSENSHWVSMYDLGFEDILWKLYSQKIILWATVSTLFFWVTNYFLLKERSDS